MTSTAAQCGDVLAASTKRKQRPSASSFHGRFSDTPRCRMCFHHFKAARRRDPTQPWHEAHWAKIGLIIALPSLRNNSCVAQDKRPASFCAAPASRCSVSMAASIVHNHFWALSASTSNLAPSEDGETLMPSTVSALPNSSFLSATEDSPSRALTSLAMHPMACSAHPGLSAPNQSST